MKPVFLCEIISSRNRLSWNKMDCRDAVDIPAVRCFFYRTVMTTVFELGNVSVPPGPKVTVPITLNTALDVPAAGVTF